MESGNINTEAMAAIREALERRGMGDKVPALNQQSLNSPTASPLPPQGSAVSSSMPTSTPLMPTEALPPVQTSQGNPEAKMIISALRERLKAISTIEGGIPQKTSGSTL